MSSQPVEANVVLTSDNSQYNQSMQQSAGATNALSASIDSLSAKISSLSKTAGKSLIGLGAGDVATITATTAAFASYEKQMAQLNAQSAILTKTNTAQKQTMKDYTLAVKDLRREYGVTTTAAASLVQTLSKITNVKQSRDLKDLSKVFEDMSKATGENADGLAQSLTGLQKMMGTQVSSTSTRKYADQFTYLAAKTNTSAQGLIDFTAQLAPAARAMGMTSDQVAGFATSFTKAGQDSGPAAMVFTKITNDITHSLATGSPEIAHYANLLGITQKAFKKMDAGEQVISILEKLQSEGKGAATELARLGLDGPRSLKALQSIIAQGGLRLDQREAKTAGGPSKGATKEGADNAATLSESFDKLSESVKQFAETFGSYFAPTINFMVKGLNKLMDVANAVTDGPFGKMVALFMGLAAPIMIGVGALLLFAGTLTKVAMAFAVFRSSGAYGIREGLKGGAGMTAAPGGGYMARGGEGAFLGQRGAQIATDPRSSWAMRSSYNAGQGIGGLLRGSFTGGVGGIRNLTAKFTGREVEAGPVRSPLSYVAGGAGRFMQNFVTPQFDQMRYANPADRKIWMNNQAPWASIGDKTRLLGQMGRVSGAESDLERIRKSELSIRKDTGLDPMEKQAKLDSIKTMKEEAKTRLNTSQYAERSTRETIEAQGRANAATKDTTVGMERLGVATKQLGANVGGGMLGGMRAGAGLAWRSGAVGQMGGMGAMMAGSALGSSTLMLGGMGASIGSLAMGPGLGTAIGAGIGGTAGAIMDVAKSNKGMFDMIHQVKDLGDETQKSGVGLSDYTDQLAKSQQGLADKSKAIGVTGDQSDFWFGAPSISKAKALPGMTKNAIEGLFGRSDISEATGQQATEAARQKNQEQAARDLAAASGVTIRGTKAQQLTALDDFMGSLGAQRFKDAGIDPSQYYSARQKAQTKVTQEDMGPVQFDAQHNPIDRSKDAAAINARNQKSYDDMTKKLASAGTGITDIVKENLAKTDVGKAMEASKNVQEAEKHQENVEATYKGIQDMYTTMKGEGKSNIDVMHSAAQAMSKIGEENNKPFELTYGLFQKAQQNEQMQMPLMTRAQQFQSTIGQLGALENVAPTTPAQRTLVEQKKMETAQGVTDQVSYVKQMLLMQDQYEIQKQRASDAYALQQTYQLHDYNLQRSRAEYSFNLGRTRATADYHRQLTRGNFEFNLQRKRQEQDFNHQTQVMAKQMAMSVYDIYNRVQVERTSSAAWLISNAHDQLVQMQQQETNLKKLRKMGMTDDTIQQLKLTDPAQAQQAANLVATATVGQIKTMNKVIGAERIKAAKDLVQDPSSLDNAERMRGYRRARQQALDDHNRSLKWAREDFMRQMKQQKEDFDLMMHQQATDFQTSMNRQEKAYRLSMKNSAEDLANAGKEITGSIEQILKQGSTHLTGYAQATAQAALDTFTGLKKSTRPVAIAIMKDLSEIFGFEYKAPKLSSNNEKPAPVTQNSPSSISGRHSGTQRGFHKGGVVPGWSPGTDDTMVPLSGGESIMRPEWTRAVGGEKAVEAMNHAAKHGGFAAGGVFKPINLPVTNGLHDAPPISPYTAIDFAASVGTPVYAVTAGKITRSYDITGIEPRRALYGKSQDGFKSYGRVMYLQTNAGPEVLYAHLSKRGYGAGARVKGGDPIGLSGDTGNSTGPHLHFGDNDGDPYEFVRNAGKGVGTIKGGVDGGSAQTKAQARQQIRDVFKKLYADPEKKAHAMQGVHPLFPGDISHVINKFGHDAVRKLTKKYGLPDSGAGAGATDLGSAPSGHLGNEKLVHTAANRMGWGNQWDALRQIVMHESGFNNTAQNPSSTAYGMFQFLDGTWAGYGGPKTSDPWKQAQYGMNYIKGRYGDPHGAWDFWQAHNWYGDGAVFNGAQTIGVGEKGPEAVIPLNERGGEFLTRAMMGVDARRIGLGASPMSGGINVYNTRVDRSTNFTGAIHVTANDPNELIRKMQARQRVLALSRPSLTGSAA